ncbi:MAG: serine/threonine protein phosphatase [Pirellulaceae bacterium]|nr:MAG: serine/threonine protein phosphatase [Pirellulaceae bacterium]
MTDGQCSTIRTPSNGKLPSDRFNSSLYNDGMAGRLIAIGDIHGCATALERLIEAIAPRAEDTLVTLGDYVDRGPDSKGVIDRLIDLQQQCRLVALQGNHEEMMLDVVRDHQPYESWLRYGGVDTLDSYGFVGDLSVIPPSHFAFFESMVDYYETDTHFFVHANYDPVLPLEETDTYTLRWLKLSQFVPAPHFSGKRAVVGHTHDRGGEIFDVGHLVCLDTYCYGGQWLTAMDVKTGQVWQASQQGRLRERAGQSGDR